MTTPTAPTKATPSSWVLVAVAWTLVGIPLAWGIYRTLLTAVKLFR
jgi:hypothetical protein